MTRSGRDHGLSWPVACAAFTVDPDTGVLTQIVDRWHTGFVDLDGRYGLLGQVEGRSAADAGVWLAARP